MSTLTSTCCPSRQTCYLTVDIGAWGVYPGNTSRCRPVQKATESNRNVANQPLAVFCKSISLNDLRFSVHVGSSFGARPQGWFGRLESQPLVGRSQYPKMNRS